MTHYISASSYLSDVQEIRRSPKSPENSQFSSTAKRELDYCEDHGVIRKLRPEKSGRTWTLAYSFPQIDESKGVQNEPLFSAEERSSEGVQKGFKSGNAIRKELELEFKPATSSSLSHYHSHAEQNDSTMLGMDSPTTDEDFAYQGAASTGGLVYPKGAIVSGSEFVKQAREMFRARPCIQAAFSTADAELARELERAGLSIEELEKVVLLGCTRKYISCINNKTQSTIVSLRYFLGIVNEMRVEMREHPPPQEFWESMRRRLG